MARGALLWLLGVPIPNHHLAPTLLALRLEPHKGDKRYVRRKRASSPSRQA
jgi:hypothetical protein